MLITPCTSSSTGQYSSATVKNRCSPPAAGSRPMPRAHSGLSQCSQETSASESARSADQRIAEASPSTLAMIAANTRFRSRESTANAATAAAPNSTPATSATATTVGCPDGDV